MATHKEAMMIRIEMTVEEADLVRRVLDVYVSNLRAEIHHTDNREYRETLKQEREILRGVLHRLEHEHTSVAT